MKATITDKHLVITNAIKKRLDQKFGKVLMDLQYHTDTHVVLTTEKHRQTTEITVKTKGNSLHVKEETEELYTSIDHAVDKMEKQIRKRKDHIVSLKVKLTAAKNEKIRP